MTQRVRCNLLWVSDALCEYCTYLENVKGFKLDIFAFLLQHGHHQFKIFFITDVFSHDSEVMPV